MFIYDLDWCELVFTSKYENENDLFNMFMSVDHDLIDLFNYCDDHNMILSYKDMTILIEDK